MRFGEVCLADARGAVLAHSLTLPDGKLRKGSLLTAEDVDRIAATGRTSVVVARLDPGDVGEDAAATTLAEALVSGAAGLVPGRAATGRVNILARGPGLARIDAARIDAANAIDPMITVATVPQWRRMGAGGMVATVKIISYGVAGAALERAAAAGRGGLGFAAPVLGTVALVTTRSGPSRGRAGTAPERPEKAVEVTRERILRLGLDLVDWVDCGHDADDIAGRLMRADADLVLVLAGSATSDIGDVVPEAVRRAGGTVTHFGMPVDPGNLLMLGEVGGTPVIGLPGCARSPALNGADWVLERIACGVPVTSADIGAMGVGGLLKDVPERGRPRRA